MVVGRRSRAAGSLTILEQPATEKASPRLLPEIGSVAPIKRASGADREGLDEGEGVCYAAGSNENSSGGDTHVSTPTEAIREQLMAANEEYRQLQQQHATYAAELDRLNRKPHLSDQEKMEEIRLKKLKLRLKDQMATLLQNAQKRN